MSAKKNTKYTGLQAIAKGTVVNVREYADIKSKILKIENRLVNGKVTPFGQLTGFYFVDSDKKTWLHLIAKTYKGWVRSDVINTIPATKSDSEAQELINNIIQTNIEIRKKLITMIPILKKLRNENKLTNAQIKQFKDLGSRLLNRENEIKSNTALKVEKGILQEYNLFMQKYNLTGLSISGSDNLGAAPVVLLWVVGVVVVAGLGAGIYAYFNKYWGESKVDLKISEDLERALSTLDPETAKEVKDDLQEQIDQAYNKGREDEMDESGLFGNMKPILYVVLGMIGFKYLTK